MGVLGKDRTFQGRGSQAERCVLEHDLYNSSGDLSLFLVGSALRYLPAGDPLLPTRRSA